MTTETIVLELNKILQTAIQAETADGSYAGEFAHLDKLLETLGIHGGYVVDIAAADGYTQSSTLGFSSGKHGQGSLWRWIQGDSPRLRLFIQVFRTLGLPGIGLPHLTLNLSWRGTKYPRILNC